MGILDLIAVVIICLTIILVVAGYTSSKFDTTKIEKENQELKKKLSKKTGGKK